MKFSRWSTLLQNQAVAIVLLLLFLVPILFAAPAARRIDQLTAYGFLGLLLFAVWAFRGGDSLSLARVREWVTSGPNPAILLYVAWNVASLLFSTEPFYTQIALLQLVVGVLLYGVVVYQFRHGEQVRALLAGMLVVGVALVVIALAADNERRLTQLSGWFHDRQLFGAFLMLLLPLTLGVAAGAKNRGWKAGAQLAAVLLAGGILLTGCRSAWLGVATGVLTFLTLSALFVWKLNVLQRKKHEFLLTPLLGLAVIGIFVMFVNAGGPIGWRASSLSSLEAVQKDDSVRDRMNLAGYAMKAIGDRPITGWGPGSYAIVQTRYNPEPRNEVLIRQMGPSLWESPHNTYLQIAAEQGLIGLALYLAILGSFFFYGVRALRKLDRGLRQYTLIGCLSAVAAHAVDGVGNPAYFFPEVTTFFWLLLGVGMCAAGLGLSPEQAAEPAEGAAPAVRRVLGLPLLAFRALRLGLTVLAVGALGLQFLSVNLSAASAGPPPPIDDDDRPGGGGAPRPIYCEFITRLGLDFLNDGIDPPAAFGILSGSVSHNQLASFHVYALTDDPRFYANVTSERRFLGARAVGLPGSFRFGGGRNNPRIFFNPARRAAGRTGTLIFSYRCTKPRRIFTEQFTLTVTDPGGSPDSSFGPLFEDSPFARSLELFPQSEEPGGPAIPDPQD